MIKIVLDDGVRPPEYKTEGSSGMDVSAQGIIRYGEPKMVATMGFIRKQFDKEKEINILPGERLLVDTGITLAHMEPGHEIQVRSRSGMTLKKGLVVLNSPGTIDSDYRGRIGVVLYNSSKTVQHLLKGDRIAQLVVAPVKKEEIEVVESVNGTERGDGGFGSTGTN